MLSKILFIVQIWAGLSFAASGPLRVHDIFGRDVLGRGQIISVDWDGFIANPAVQLRISGPQDAPEGTYPIGVRVHSPNPRVYFDLEGTTQETGSDRKLTLKDAKASIAVYFGVWPDRDSEDEDIPIQVFSRDSKGVTGDQPLVIHVIDEDGEEVQAEQLSIQRERSYPFLSERQGAPDIRPPSPFFSPQSTLSVPAPFNIMMDTSYDKTGIMNSNAEFRRTARRAMDDWAYFLKPLDIDPVEIGEEQTVLADFEPTTKGWKTKEEKIVTNQVPFKDMLFYIVSTNIPSGRAACIRSDKSGYMSKGSEVFGLRRSGTILLSFAPPGFDPTMDDAIWWRSFVLKDGGTFMDLYSTVLHETGHGLGITFASRDGERWYRNGYVDNFAVEYYLGRRLAFNKESHLVQGRETVEGQTNSRDIPEIDPLSGKPGFGGVRGWMQHRRWIITKLDLLVLKALGYYIRDTSALQDLKMQAEVPSLLSVGKPVKVQLSAQGGVPAYDWDLEIGRLPLGLSLDRFTGVISGSPQHPGIYNFVVRVRDSAVVDTQGIRRAFQIRVTMPKKDV